MSHDDLPQAEGLATLLRDLVDLQRETLHVLRSIDVELRGNASRLREADIDPALADLLHAIVAWNGGNGVAFSMSMLVEKCAEDRELHAAVLACVGMPSTKKLGQLFASNKDRDIGGLVITRSAKARLWAIKSIPDPG